MGCLFRAALSCRCPKISPDSSWLRDPIIHSEYGLEEEGNSADIAVALNSISVFVKAAFLRNSSMRVLILAQAPHLNLSYRNQVVWRIPEELMKGVS
jgi:hypothetical protein